MNGAGAGPSWQERAAGAFNRMMLTAENTAGSINYPKVIARLGEYSTRENLNVSVLQIGANDGRRGDLIQDCIRDYGWRGLLVEPVKREYETLRTVFDSQVREGRLNIVQCAVAGRDGRAHMYGVRSVSGDEDEENSGQLAVPELLQGLESLDKEWLTGQMHERCPDVPSGLLEVQEIGEVETYTVSSLKRFLTTSDFFNVISVNAAGLDSVIMSQMQSSQMRPKFYLFNHSNMKISERHKRHSDLRNQGYVYQILNDRFTFAELQ
jgi:hypothetical protein